MITGTYEDVENFQQVHLLSWTVKPVASDFQWFQFIMNDGVAY